MLLQAKSDVSDVQRRIANGEDSQKLRDMLKGMTKRIAGYEKELAAAAAERKAAETKVAEDNAKKAAGGGEARRAEKRPPKKERAPLPDDLELPCCDCNNSFTFTGKDQLFFQKQGWPAPPRCFDCREAKKSAKPKGITITCGQCSKGFFFSEAKARVFEEKKYPQPKWCVTCRADRKADYAKKSEAGSQKSKGSA